MLKPRAIRISLGNEVLKSIDHELSFDELKAACKLHGITDSVRYREMYKSIPGFPAHPERKYSLQWTSYKDFFDIKEFIPYESLINIIHPLKLKNAREYRKFVLDKNDVTIPLDPTKSYENDWINWYRFLGKEEPYQPIYISTEYSDWKNKIEEFMKRAKGGGSKVTNLCRFVRLYIEKHDKSLTVQDFVTQGKFNLKPFRTELDKIKSDNLRRNIIIAVNQFFDYAINKYFTIEDEDTGEITRILNARNPFSLFLTDQSVVAPSRSESTKPCLPYHFVRKVRQWIANSKHKYFRDLKHLQKFDADWVRVSPKEIDQKDPDCVYKKVDGKYFLWVPIDWIHVLALTSVPLRGRQIAYNDSGEADDYIADTDLNGAIVWVKNTSKIAGLTSKQSFIKRLPEDEIGMYVTTNKTANNGAGYSIPWMPEDLAYWLVRLRKWQQKYNPIQRPTRWEECSRTSFNEIQLKAKGANCFLFRAYSDIEPRDVATALTARLAASLYHIQPSDLKLAHLDGGETTLSLYTSRFTPHSMRVSLITAYVVEFGMPIEIVMKVVGHSSVIMTIYYTKLSHSKIRQKLEEGEKIALKGEAQATQQIIEQNRIESVKNFLVGSNEDLLKSLSNDVPAGNYVFRDYGICPYAASRCGDGGDFIAGSGVREPVSLGYLGIQNCLRCRHFITGPAFLGGLLSVANEILLQSNTQSSKCHSLQQRIDLIERDLDELDRNEYIANLKGEKFSGVARDSNQSELRRLGADYESAAKKLDGLLCDLQSAAGLIRRCQLIVRSDPTLDDDEKKSVALLAAKGSDLEFEIEEVSYFEQLQEVCENATIYQSASAENAILPRSQLLDRMAQFNNISPSLFMLSEEDQLRVGNELFKYLKGRLKTLSKVVQVVNCEITIDELLGSESISRSEIQIITNSKVGVRPVLRHETN